MTYPHEHRVRASAVPPDTSITTFIKATPERIWQALTESRLHGPLLLPVTVDSDWTAGLARRATGSTARPAIEGEVLEADPPRRLAMTFHAVWDQAVARRRAVADDLRDRRRRAGRHASSRSSTTASRAETETYRQVTGGWS